MASISHARHGTSSSRSISQSAPASRVVLGTGAITDASGAPDVNREAITKDESCVVVEGKRDDMSLIDGMLDGMDPNGGSLQAETGVQAWVTASNQENARHRQEMNQRIQSMRTKLSTPAAPIHPLRSVSPSPDGSHSSIHVSGPHYTTHLSPQRQALPSSTSQHCQTLLPAPTLPLSLPLPLPLMRRA